MKEPVSTSEEKDPFIFSKEAIKQRQDGESQDENLLFKHLGRIRGLMKLMGIC